MTQPFDSPDLPASHLAPATGCLIGCGIGDALGHPTEFMGYQEILSRYGASGIVDLPDPALVTDDTQMALAVARALDQTDLTSPDPDQFATVLGKEFVHWLEDPQNNRAPGNTCIAACNRLRNGYRWQEASRTGSKGCGANMRVQPVALAYSDLPTVGAAAQLQAAITHGHPTALAVTDLTAAAIWALRNGITAATLLGWLDEYAQSRTDVYEHAWLGDLWNVAGASSAQDYIRAGWQESQQALARVRHALNGPTSGDPCQYTGEGWTADDAFATSLFVYLLHPTDPVAAVRRGANSNGDSDSIACLVGSYAGAEYGLAAWPSEWVARLEYRSELLHFGSLWER